MKKIILLLSVMFSTSVYSGQAFEGKSCFIFAEIIKAIETARDEGLSKKEFIEIVKNGEQEELVKEVAIKNAEFIYNLKKGTRYSNSVKRICAEKGYIAFIDV